MMKKILRQMLSVLAAVLSTVPVVGGTLAPESVFPHPQETAADGKYLKLPEKLGIACPAGLQTAAEDLRKLCLVHGARINVEPPERALIRLTLRKEGTPEHDEGYILCIDGNGVEISARAEPGLFYGLQTLRAMLTTAGSAGLPHCRIVDRPQFDLRAVAFSLRGAGPDQLEQLEKYLLAAAALKYNCAAIEFAENFPYRDDPFIAKNKRLSEADIRGIVKFAEAHFIKIIPLLRIWNDCPILAAYPQRDGMLELPYGKNMRYTYCPRNRGIPALIGKVVSAQTKLLHSDSFIFHLDCTGFRQTSRQCAECRNTALDKLAAEHFAELGKVCTANGVKAEFVISADPSRLQFRSPKKKIKFLLFDRFGRISEAPLGHPLLMKRNIRCAAENGKRRFVLDGMVSIRHGMLLPLANNTVYSLTGLVDGAGYLWSGAKSHRHPDAVPYFFSLFHGRCCETEIPAATPVPLDRTVNAVLNHCGDFSAFAPKQLNELVQALAARPERFRLTTGRGNCYYGIRLAGSRVEDPYPEKAKITLDGVKASAIDILLSCTAPPQQADYSPWHGGDKIFSAPQVAAVTVNYENGKKLAIPLRYTSGITCWNHPCGGYKLRIAATVSDTLGRSCHFDSLRLKNPHPEQPIESIIFSSARHDGIAPVLLALSLENAQGGNLPVGNFDAVSPSHRIPEEIQPARYHNVQWDFEDSKLKNAYVEVNNMIFADGKSVKIDYVADSTSPSHSRVLRITLPPATAKNPELPLKLVVNFPWMPRGTVKALLLSCRVDRSESLSGAFQMLVNTLDNSCYTQEFYPSEKWGVFHSATDNRDTLSVNKSRDIRRSNMRKAVFVFRELPQETEIRLDDIGISRFRRHDLPAFMAE